MFYFYNYIKLKMKVWLVLDYKISFDYVNMLVIWNLRSIFLDKVFSE